MLVKIIQGGVALNPNSQLLVNRAPCPELFFLRTTRSQTQRNWYYLVASPTSAGFSSFLISNNSISNSKTELPGIRGGLPFGP